MSKKLTTEEFIRRAKLVHGDKYDYSLVNYINSKTKVKIVCSIHGLFLQTPEKHIKRKQGCPICGLTKSTEVRTLTAEEFVKKAKLVHGDKYDYSLIDYKNAHIPVEIICPIHGSFWQRANNHLLGVACPYCSSSKGEEKIARFLESNGIIFERQKKFDDLKDKSFLSFDFFLPEKNILIEYNGIQHYKSVERFGGAETLKRQKRHDALKAKYAKEHGYRLIIIPFTKKEKIDTILAEDLC